MELHGINGLSAEEVKRRKGAKPVIEARWSVPFWLKGFLGIFKEPMVILLLLASGIYLSTGQWKDGLFLGLSVIVVASISLFQDVRSRTALDSLKAFTAPRCKVIRDGVVVVSPTDDLVQGDAVIIEEGELVPADGQILHANDLTVNESILTGESLPVAKSHTGQDNLVFQGTAVTGGLAIVSVTACGPDTEIRQIEKSLNDIKTEKTLLERQINNFVKNMAIGGAVVFIIMCVVSYLHSLDLSDSLLKALTLAMSILPEEIPVAFTTFMAMGAWKLMKAGVVVKDLKTVETLGSATVICLDKTGTITQNKMELAEIWLAEGEITRDVSAGLGEHEAALIETAMWASEPIPFDPMEKAIHNCYTNTTDRDRRSEFKMLYEYPLSGQPPMMTHIFESKSGERIIACKGAPEAIMKVSGRENDPQILTAMEQMAAMGYRVLGVAASIDTKSPFPETQQEIRFSFKGLISFYDPPKENMSEVLRSFYEAGIAVKIITGDNEVTTATIARQIGFKGLEGAMGGQEVMDLTADQLRQRVMKCYLFTRMFPEAKLRVINALLSCGEIVAMTGDGVNDAPALKAAHIGVAMGNKGTQVAREAARLILLQDDLQGMVTAIALGRRIYGNLKKAIRYIISIHIPIILIVSVPMVFQWAYPTLFSPVHIIFLELIMGPTCSLIYENEPAEKNAMMQNPGKFNLNLFSSKELFVSIIQGLAIALGLFALYQYAASMGFSAALGRTLIFSTLIFANITLTLVNRSFYYSIVTTFRYRNRLVTIMIGLTLIFLFASLYLQPFSAFFGFLPLQPFFLAVSAGVGCLSVLWYEVVKWFMLDKTKL